jgi:hypothetical protein
MQLEDIKTGDDLFRKDKSFLSFSNYNKPSNPLFKRIGDICLFTIPLYIPILTSIPILENTKLWIIGILSIVLATVKIISKFSLNPNFKDNVDSNIELGKENS